MSLTSDLTEVRYYTQADPYFYTVDNRPLQDLATRDEEIATAVEERTIGLRITGSATPTINFSPGGFTCTSSATGVYTLTHNFGNTNYVLTGNIIDASGGVLFFASQAANSIVIKTVDLAGSPAHLQFFLSISRYTS